MSVVSNKRRSSATLCPISKVAEIVLGSSDARLTSKYRPTACGSIFGSLPILAPRAT